MVADFVESGSRPDDRTVAYDYSCVSPDGSQHAKRAAETPGFAAQVVAGEKNEKYAGPCKKKGIFVQTLIMEESGFRGQGLRDFIHLCAARAHDHHFNGAQISQVVREGSNRKPIGDAELWESLIPQDSFA